TFFKVKGTDEILGGYNPIIWSSTSSHSWGKTKYSFIFSFKNKNNFFKDIILSNVENIDGAVHYYHKHGPHFGEDLLVWSSGETADYSPTSCRKKYYEKKIRDTDGRFSLEDYEVFQIIKR